MKLFKKTKKNIFEDPEYLQIRTLMNMNEINESQKRLKVSTEAEYLSIQSHILHEIEKKENVQAEEKELIFDE